MEIFTDWTCLLTGTAPTSVWPTRIPESPIVNSPIVPDSSASSLAAPSPSDNAGETTYEGEQPTILLVDDEHGVRTVARIALERGGYYVLEAINGDDAIRVANTASRRIDLLLTDIVMPQLSGLELAQILRTRNATLCVLYMSGFSQDLFDFHDALHMERTHYIMKPFTLAELRARVSQVMALDAADTSGR